LIDRNRTCKKAKNPHTINIYELQIPKTTVGEDMLYLRKQAKETIKEYVTEHLPEQYQVCLSALDTILKHAYHILENSHDNREKLHAMEVFKDTHVMKLELLSNATTIDRALEYIRGKQQAQEKHLDSSTTVDSAAAGRQEVF
jgi:hypothetical protein